MAEFYQCDCCARLTDRLHHLVAYGTDTAVCDACCDYDADAYGEPPARYLDEQPDPEEEAEHDRRIAYRWHTETEP
jgi:hypothetical protein